jgi:hypothetical protein
LAVMYVGLNCGKSEGPRPRRVTLHREIDEVRHRDAFRQGAAVVLTSSSLRKHFRIVSELLSDFRPGLRQFQAVAAASLRAGGF